MRSICSHPGAPATAPADRYDAGIFVLGFPLKHQEEMFGNTARYTSALFPFLQGTHAETEFPRKQRPGHVQLLPYVTHVDFLRDMGAIGIRFCPIFGEGVCLFRAFDKAIPGWSSKTYWPAWPTRTGWWA